MKQSKEKEPPSSFPCRWKVSLGLIIVSLSTVFSQNLICKTVDVGIPVRLDTLLVEPGSIQLEYAYIWNDSTQILLIEGKEGSTSTVCYRVIAPALTQTYQARDIKTYDEAREVMPLNANRQLVEKEEVFDFEGVQKYGAISRGISFGNRQSLFVNSSLNLQMNGKLDDNLNIAAVITDQNVPYQPEGNTQQIRDFDNVFIKLYNDKFDLTAGDIVLTQPNTSGYFLKYLKNVQGLQVGYKGQVGDWKSKSQISGAISKGKFHSSVVEAIDGLNGPYRLRGPNGERFIIVLANSEKVFLDGKKLERGFDRDYIIDYNLGEITFNNHIVITQFSIIRIDFEYAEQFYSRSNVAAYQELSKDKVKFYANYYRERDNPNATFGLSLSDEDLTQLSGLGDNVDQAFVTGFDSVRFSENRILYVEKDTIDSDGRAQRIFETSSDPNRELFSPLFSEVGFGNGDYVLAQSTANGRAYEWVSPINGQRQGNYNPGAFMPLPNSRQMITLGGEVAVTPYESIATEVAFSETDLNGYSDLDDSDNASRGYYLSFTTENRPAPLRGYKWIGGLTMEYDESNFTFIDRYRRILFDRDWNFEQDQLDNLSSDFILSLQAGVQKDDRNQFIARLNRRKRGDLIDGWQQQVSFNQQAGYFQLLSDHFFLSNDQQEQSTSWIRSKSDVSFRKWKLVPGYVFEMDENEVAAGDSVVSSLMNFKAHQIYLESGDSSKSTFRMSYTSRRDRLPMDGDISDYLVSKNFNAAYAKRGKKGSVTADFNYRSVQDRLELNVGEDEVINGRINWIQSFWKRNVKSNLTYSTGNARELQREFVYLPVPTGEGTHTWRDLNEDGVQDLNEFFEAINPDERNFAKIFIPTDTYITSFQTFYQHTLDVRFPYQWRSQEGIRQAMSRFSINANFNVTFKTTSDDYADRLNPFSLSLDNPSLLSTRDLKRYTLFYNRNGRGVATDITFQTSDSKQLLTQGFETRENQEWISNAKIDLNAAYTLRLSSTIGRLINRSDFLETRNLSVFSNAYEPQLIWQPSNVFRAIGSFMIKRRANEFIETSNESSTSQTYKGEVVWNQAGKGSLRGTFSFINIQFVGDPISYLGYILLDALQPGSNQTWQINWQQKISKGMQLSLLYNGRKSENVAAIHTGTVQVTAFF